MSESGAPSRRFKAILQYDGTAYRGWQRQADAVTVQAACEASLEAIVGQPVGVVASGRTDTGVHARGQVVHFSAATRLTPAELRRAWNARLPGDIWAARVGRAPADFHARFDAVARTYRYRLALGDHAGSPFVRRYSWPIERALDWSLMYAMAAQLAGVHDFRRFAKGAPPARPLAAGPPGECTVLSARWRPTREGRALDITADRFLRHMVRALVGALVAIGLGRASPAALSAALRPGGERVRATYAPPQGLFLWHVGYSRRRDVS
ncbi:MAG: tRNA pseudouridine(38-40) synthase TruA [Gemmatimonadota bacterium]